MGARLNSGAAPDPRAMRRLRPGDSSSWTTLPGHGLSAVPPWPRNFDRPSSAERSIWGELWSNQPQAHVWAAVKMEMIVAVYVRSLIRASSASASATDVTQCRQMGDSLLLTPAALRSSRYIIDVGPEAGMRVLPGVSSTAPVVGMPGSRVGSGVLSRLAPVPNVPEDEDEGD